MIPTLLIGVLLSEAYTSVQCQNGRVIESQDAT